MKHKETKQFLHLMLLLFIILLLVLIRESQATNYTPVGQFRKRITQVVQTLQSTHSNEKASLIANSILKMAIKHQIDWQILTAMMYQESRLLADPRGCNDNVLNCHNDYGLGQVNIKYWGKKLNMDINRANTDELYGLELTDKVLTIIRKTYKKNDGEWYWRYHSSTPKVKEKYKKAVMEIYVRILELK